MLRPRNPQNASMNTPAIRKRTAHISAGGMRSTAISIARYVDPQKKYTSPKARITANRLWRWALVIFVDQRISIRHNKPAKRCEILENTECRGDTPTGARD